MTIDPENPLEKDILSEFENKTLYRALLDLVDELRRGLPRLTAQDVNGLAAVENQMVFLYNAHAFIIQYVSPCKSVQSAVFRYFCEQYNKDIAERFRQFVDDADPVLGITTARVKQYQGAGVLSTQLLEKQNPGVERFSSVDEPTIGTPITQRFLANMSMFHVCSVDTGHRTCPLCNSSPKEYFDKKKHTFSWLQLGHNRQITPTEQSESGLFS